MIRELTPEEVSRIAAGEVVERPLNIVKELVENAIDAKATQIYVTISDGGRDMVQVQDNGCGIPSNEIEVAFQLHTTSKLDSGDPSLVDTLGFRGEALASIAAVSRIDCRSKSGDDPGIRVILEAGRLLNKTPVEMKQGTRIKVTNIFHNIPARRKFLKSAATERKRITDLMMSYALMYPEIHFRLDEITNTKTTTRLESPPRKTMISAIYDVLGHEIANQLIQVQDTLGPWDIEGYISKPVLVRSDRSLQFITVNGRPIRHKELQQAIESAYGSQLLKSNHPVIILKITGPVHLVDFNIHPQKSEIRFQSKDSIIDDISSIISNALGTSAALPELPAKRMEQIKPQVQKGSTELPTPTPDPQSLDSFDFGLEEISKPTLVQTSLSGEIIDENAEFLVLGHVMNKFGVIYNKGELWLVDVHAADERVKFELYEKGKERKLSSQQFLQPVSVELPASEKTLILDHKDDLEKFGLKISNSTGNCILLHSIPIYFDQELTAEHVQQFLQDLISSLDDEGHASLSTPFSRIEYNIASRLACHGAIRSGYPVSKQKIAEVVKQLLQCKYPWTCAHGRPTVLRLSKSRIESWFMR